MPEDLTYRRVLYTESQRLTERWVWLISLAVPAVPLALILFGAYHRRVPLPALAIGVLGCSLPAALCFALRLRVTVTSDLLTVALFPVRKQIPIAHIATFDPCTYHPIREFGGWGIKFSFKDSTTAYTISGNQGIRLVLTTGKKLLIGTANPTEFASALTAAGVPLKAPPTPASPPDSTPETARPSPPRID